MSQKVKCEDSLIDEIEVNLNAKYTKRKFIRCIPGVVGNGTKKYGRVYVPDKYIGHKVLVLIEEQ
jgi:hypothetical protein